MQPRPPHRYQSRPGRLALVTPTLQELHGPTGGEVVLSHRLVWQAEPLRHFNLDDSFDRLQVYEIVLREAIRLDELRTWLNAGILREIWPDLYLPRGVRRAWCGHRRAAAEVRRLARPGLSRRALAQALSIARRGARDRRTAS